MAWSNFLALLVAAAPLATALNITVGSEGGNATSGHQYGFLHEVSMVLHYHLHENDL